mmetsp:Transcript_51287/g.169956  ORF Transcript_51287/g.169956 Transcript_51287/m.169956 type:complete len:219 (+) Transcript_51287:1780-2436(+)
MELCVCACEEVERSSLSLLSDKRILEMMLCLCETELACPSPSIGPLLSATARLLGARGLYALLPRHPLQPLLRGCLPPPHGVASAVGEGPTRLGALLDLVLAIVRLPDASQRRREARARRASALSPLRRRSGARVSGGIARHRRAAPPLAAARGGRAAARDPPLAALDARGVDRVRPHALALRRPLAAGALDQLEMFGRDGLRAARGRVERRDVGEGD